jgi:hypothetical protein
MPAKPLQNMLRHAARRDLIALALRQVGLWLAVACGVALLVVAADRWRGMGLSGWAYLCIAGAGVIGGVIHALIVRHDELAIALTLDRSLRLKDRIGSAIALDRKRASDAFSSDDDGFAEMLRLDAASLAGRVDVRAATPIYITGVWGVALLLAFALWAGVAFLPNFAQGRAAHQHEAELAAQQSEAQQQAQQLAESIAQATQDLPRDAGTAGGLSDEAAAAQLEALDRLAEQLNSAGDNKPEDVKAAREDSAARLDDLADRLSQQAQQELQAMEEMQRRFAGMDDAAVKDAPMTAAELAEAIKRGDFGAAGEQLQKLLDESQNEYSEHQRSAAADALRDLADRVAQTARDSNLSNQERREQARQALRDLGVDEATAQRLLDEPNATEGDTDQKPPPPNVDETRELLEEKGIDPETADRLARDLQDLREERELDERVNDDTRDLSEAIERTADAVERGEPLPEPPPQEQGDAASRDGAPATAPVQKQSEALDRNADQQSQEQSEQGQQGQQRASDNAQREGDRQQREGDEGQSQTDAQTQPGDNQREEASLDRRPSTQPQATGQERQASQTQPSAGVPTSQPEADQTQSRSGDQQQQEQQRAGAQSRAGEQPQTQPAADRQPPPATQPSSTDAQAQAQAQTQPDRATQQQQQQQQQQGQQQPSQTQPREGDQQQRQPQSSDPNAPGQPQPAPGSTPTPAPGQAGSGEREEASPDRQTSGQAATQPSPGEQSATQPSSSGQPGAMPDPNQPLTPDQVPTTLPDQLPDPNSLPDPDSIPGDVLRQLAERAKEAAKDQQTAERMRELARQLAENMTPEQRERWAEALQRELGDQQPQEHDQQQQPPPKQPGERPDQSDESPSQNGEQGEPPQPRPDEMDREATQPGENAQQPPGGARPQRSGEQPRGEQGDGASDRGGAPLPQGDREAGTSGAPQRHTNDPSRLATADDPDELDLRGAETADQIIARWLTDEQPPIEDGQVAPRATGASGGDASGGGAAAQRVRAAQKVAERAVNDAAVNKRYHRAIMRYFGRLNETIEKAAREQAPAASQPAG